MGLSLPAPVPIPTGTPTPTSTGTPTPTGTPMTTVEATQETVYLLNPPRAIITTWVPA